MAKLNENVYQVDDYKDVLRLAWDWRTYWQSNKRQMITGNAWYYKEIYISTPKQTEPHVPSTAGTLVNDAADHLAGNDPTFQVKALRESSRADEERQRVQTSLNTAFEKIGRMGGRPLHRSLAIHGGWSGMMCARVSVDEDWDVKNPTIEDIRWETQDPRDIYPDPGTGGREAVIVWKQKTVGQIRQQWPDWDGHWFPSSGSDQSYASPYVDASNNPPVGGFDGERKRQSKPLSDNAYVTWIEYWDTTHKCFIANGKPIFKDEFGYDLIEHGLGFCPFVIRSAGYGDIDGEPVYRYKSMLSNVFSELEAEAELITQLKWIVQETAWPIYLVPKDVEGEFDIEPGSINFVENPESIKAIKALREDTNEPKAIIDLLQYIKNEIERATYPEILKGQAPGGIRSGYPIAILSTQARLKFAAPNDALKEMFKEIGFKTLGIVKTRFKMPTKVMDGFSLKPEDYDTYLGRISVKLEPNLPQDLASKLPILEFLYGSAKFPALEIMRELGYEFPEQLMEQRMSEDLAHDPRVIQVMAEKYVNEHLDPAAAEAVMEVAGPQLEIQHMTQQLQEMQARMQEMEMYQQVQQQVQAQMAQQQGMPPLSPGGEAPQPQASGLPPAPTSPPPAPTRMPGPVTTVPGSAGGSEFGQNLASPGQTGFARNLINPNTQLPNIARNLNAQRQIGNITAQDHVYGNVSGGE